MNCKLITVKPTFWATSTKLDILTDQNKLVLWKNNTPQVVELINYKTLSFFLIILICKINKKSTTLPVLFGNTPIKSYKNLRAFLLCR